MNGSVNFDGTLSGSISAGGGGGGSTVVITPVVTEGTKIADVTVDGADKDLYCPTVTPTEVTVTQVQQSGTKIASIEVDGQSVDIYTPSPSTPTEVIVTQVQESGTKIATIGVDGVDTDIYAPSPSGVEYSTTEKVIGTWIDGSPLYQKTIDVGVLPNNNTKSVSIDSNIDLIIKFEGFTSSTTDRTYQRPLPMVGSGNALIRVDRNGNDLRIITYTDWTTYTGYVTITYTKQQNS